MSFMCDMSFSLDSRTIFVAIPCSVLAVLAFLFTWSADPYGTFHLFLNRLPGEDQDLPPKTEWLNMGFWKDTEIFPEACKALALRLIQAVGLQEGEKVLDVGHGSGESLILLLSDPSTPRPSSITGITSLPVHHQRSLARIEKLKPTSKGIETTLHLGDAVYKPGETSKHPLSPENSSTFNVILALDCAYHFQTRRDFLRQALEHLAPGGRIGLADICFDGAALKRSSLTRSILRMIPKENTVSMEDYVKSMEDMGYVDVQLEDISSNVFPRFTSFLKTRGAFWTLIGCMISLYWQSGGARFVLVRASKQL